jgi:excisionase family DNA binding protein
VTTNVDDPTEQRIRDLVDRLAAAIADQLRAESDALPDRLLSIDEAAAALGIGRTSLYQAMATGRVRSVHVGRRRLIPSSAIAEVAAAHQSDDRQGPR